MEKVSIADVDSRTFEGESLDRRGLSDLLGTEHLAMNYYRLDPGESFSAGLHAHRDQEEVFHVLSGTATFETKADPEASSETVEVSAGEVIRFAPGEYQQGRNEGDDPVTTVALGAPRGSRDVRVPQPCGECGDRETLRLTIDESGMGLECVECGATYDVGP